MFAFLSGLFHRGIRVQKTKAEFKSCLYDSPEEIELCVAEQMDEEAREISKAGYSLPQHLPRSSQRKQERTMKELKASAFPPLLKYILQNTIALAETCSSAR